MGGERREGGSFSFKARRTAVVGRVCFGEYSIEEARIPAPLKKKGGVRRVECFSCTFNLTLCSLSLQD